MCCLTHAVCFGRPPGSVGGASNQDTNHICGALPSEPAHLLKASPPHPITLGAGFSHVNSGGTQAPGLPQPCTALPATQAQHAPGHPQLTCWLTRSRLLGKVDPSAWGGPVLTKSVPASRNESPGQFLTVRLRLTGEELEI